MLIKNKLKILILIFAAWLANPASFAQTSPRPASQTTGYENPVLDMDFPDPTVIRAKDGYFYAYATQTIVDGKLHHIQVVRSKDLVGWERLGDALPERPVWADKPEPKFWAPHVSEADGKYFMY